MSLSGIVFELNYRSRLSRHYSLTAMVSAIAMLIVSTLIGTLISSKCEDYRIARKSVTSIFHDQLQKSASVTKAILTYVSYLHISHWLLCYVRPMLTFLTFLTVKKTFVLQQRVRPITHTYKTTNIRSVASRAGDIIHSSHYINGPWRDLMNFCSFICTNYYGPYTLL